MTRRRLLAALALIAASAAAPALAAPAAGKPQPLQVTYYYLPG